MNKKEIGKWLQFSANEILIFNTFVHNYLIDNNDKYDKFECYRLGVLCSDIPYQMKVLKSRISGDKNVDIENNDSFIDLILGYDGLIDYVVENFIKSFNSLDNIKKYEYMNSNLVSYFKNSDHVNLSLINDIEKVFQ